MGLFKLNDSLICALLKYRDTLEKTKANKTVFSVQRMIHEWWKNDVETNAQPPRVFSLLGSAYCVMRDYPDSSAFYKPKAVLCMLDLIIHLLETNELVLVLDYHKSEAFFYWNTKQ